LTFCGKFESLLFPRTMEQSCSREIKPPRGSRITVELSGGTARSLSSCTIGSPLQSFQRPNVAQRAVRAAAGYAAAIISALPRTRQQLWPPSEQRWDAGKTAAGFRSCMMKEIEPCPRSIRRYPGPPYRNLVAGR